jgi:osmotically-inducible protein OsmY
LPRRTDDRWQRINAAWQRGEQLPPIEVRAHLGTVTLQGRVPTAEVKQVAEQIARQMAGVQNVINTLEVGGSQPQAAPPR